ncbi:MAG: hypothetical protein LBB41_03370 [Prevotellaceae bacterium]|jgi:hypothetical protein|nr:hypothetical protein [Prevotellaceae bacterium]
MGKRIFFIGTFCCFLLLTAAQNIVVCDTCTKKLTLNEENSLVSISNQEFEIKIKNGGTFKGNIIMQTETMIILKTTDGARFQFPMSDIENVTAISQSLEPYSEAPISEFKILIDIDGGSYFKNRAFDGVGCFSGDIVLGVSTFNQFYLGVGVGYESVFAKPENVNLLKIFFKMQKTFSSKTFSPYSSLDFGYSLISNENWRGGLFVKASGGVSVRVGNNNFLLLGLNLGIQGCIAPLTETRNGEIYIYSGSTFLPKFGVSAGIMF